MNGLRRTASTSLPAPSPRGRSATSLVPARPAIILSSSRAPGFIPPSKGDRLAKPSAKLASVFDEAIEALKPEPRCKLCVLPAEVRAEVDRRLRETDIHAKVVQLALERLGHKGIPERSIQRHRRLGHCEAA